jgi:apolipoprotein D and lipocalin family protein
VDAKGNRLKVSFPNNWFSKVVTAPPEGNYWIIDVSPDYRRAIVGTPDRRSLWFLSRSPVIASKDFEEMKATAAAQAFDTSDLRIDGHTRIESRGRVVVPKKVASERPAKTKR